MLTAAYQALRPDGLIVVWLYGKEGNRFVVTMIRAMRSITTHLPHALLATLASACNVVLDIYIPLCRPMRFLPLADYVRNVIGKFDRQSGLIDLLNWRVVLGFMSFGLAACCYVLILRLVPLNVATSFAAAQYVGVVLAAAWVL